MPTTRYATLGVSHPNPPSYRCRVAIVLVLFAPHELAFELIYWANGDLSPLPGPPGLGRVAVVVCRSRCSEASKAKPHLLQPPRLVSCNALATHAQCPKSSRCRLLATLKVRCACKFGQLWQLALNARRAEKR